MDRNGGIMKIGIIGTGKIASAVVTGFCLKLSSHYFFLSPRNSEKSASLAAKFANVKVCDSNQDVLNNAEMIFISLSKKDFNVINELKFKSDHEVINMAAEMGLDDLKSRVGDAKVLAHVIPLPMCANGYGPLLVYPEVDKVKKLFEPIGDVIFAANVDDIRTFQIITGLMSPYYMLMNEIADFAVNHGLDRDLSIVFQHSLFSALSRRAAETIECDLVELAHDMTPGGYNEQAMTELMKNGSLEAWNTTLENLMGRLKANVNT
jgi:pyrroline-5-carboxylate reductase